MQLFVLMLLPLGIGLYFGIMMMREDKMNAKQALKLCSKQLEETEAVLQRAQQDIKDYNACIDSMIQGGSPCEYCEEYIECQLQAKDGKGCSEWWLRFKREDKADEGEGVLPESGENGVEAEGPAGKIKAF